MPSKCCVPGCSSSGGFHFPEDPVLTEAWNNAIYESLRPNQARFWNPSASRKHSRVCFAHFRPEDYTVSDGGTRKRLTKGSVPSLFHEDAIYDCDYADSADYYPVSGQTSTGFARTFFLNCLKF